MRYIEKVVIFVLAIVIAYCASESLGLVKAQVPDASNCYCSAQTDEGDSFCSIGVPEEQWSGCLRGEGNCDPASGCGEEQCNGYCQTGI